MNREEAVKILSAKADYQRMILGKYNQDVTLLPDAKTLQALEMGISALLGPQPDPITGLVPCGCGGKAKVWPDGVKDRTYHVVCGRCRTGGPHCETPGQATQAWNRAMRYREVEG